MGRRKMPHFIVPRERDAWATIRGYAYTDHAKLEALHVITSQIEQRLEAVEEQLRNSVLLQVPRNVSIFFLLH